MCVCVWNLIRKEVKIKFYTDLYYCLKEKENLENKSHLNLFKQSLFFLFWKSSKQKSLETVFKPAKISVAATGVVVVVTVHGWIKRPCSNCWFQQGSWRRQAWLYWWLSCLCGEIKMAGGKIKNSIFPYFHFTLCGSPIYNVRVILM